MGEEVNNVNPPLEYESLEKSEAHSTLCLRWKEIQFIQHSQLNIKKCKNSKY